MCVLTASKMAMDLITFLFIAVFSVLLMKWILKRKKLFSTFERLGIPGPKPSFFTGNMSLLSKPYFEVDFIEKYGSIYGFFIGAKPLLAVNDPEFLKIIQVKESQMFHARNSLIPQASTPSHLFHLSIPLASGQRWKENRDALTPAYTTSKFKMMNAIINNELDKAVDEITKFAEKQQPLELERIYSPAFGNIALQITFGIKMKDKEDKSANFLFDSIRRASLPTFADPEIFLSLCFPELEKLLSYLHITREWLRKIFKYTSFYNVQSICNSVLTARMNDKTATHVDALQFMIKALKSKMNSASESKNIEHSKYAEKSHMQEEDILANSLYLSFTTFILSVASTMYGTYELAKSSRVQKKLRKEIFDVNGHKEHITYENLCKMQYLDQVYNEVLRLHPSAPFFTNRISEEDYYYKGKLIPKGTTLYIPQLGMHRSPSNFPDPEAFLPERFDDNKIDPYIYQPFGIGPRHCPGMRLARYFGKMVIARVIQSFNLSVSPEEKPLEPEFHFLTNHPKGPVRLIASPA